MLRLVPDFPVYIAKGATDLRNNIDGLSIIIERVFRLDPFSPAMFVFCNKSRNKLKILFWDKNGFWLYYKRLESGRFKWPCKDSPEKTMLITQRELSWILDGFSLSEPEAFEPVLSRKIY